MLVFLGEGVDDVENQNLPDLKRPYLVFDYIPDEKVMQAMEKKCGNGETTPPVCPMWNAVIAGIVFQHESIESLIRELSRNPKLAIETIPDVLNIAMMIETQALDLYLMRYSNRTKDEKSKGVLFEIAQEEKAHLAALGCVWIRRCKFFPRPDAPYADQKRAVDSKNSCSMKKSSDHWQ